MTLTLKKTLLTGTALLVVGAFAPFASAATLTTSANLTDHSYDTGDVAGTDLTANPVINIDDASVLTFTTSLNDNDNTGSANNNVVLISANGGGVTVNTGVTLQQSAGTGDVIATSGDRSGVVITLTGTALVAASSNTQDAINLASLGAANGATININGGADVTGVITGGAGGDTMAIALGGANTSTFNGAINLGAGTDAINITGSGGTANFQGNVQADAINVGAGATADLDAGGTGTVNLQGAASTLNLEGTLTGSVANTLGTAGTGVLTTAGTGSVTSNVGATGVGTLATISNTGAGTFGIGGNAFATNITNGAGGQLNVTGTTNATTLTNSAGGSMTLGGATTVANTVELDGAGNINFNGTAAATTYNVDGTGTLNFQGTGAVTGDIVFSAAGGASFGSTVTTYTGAITNDSGVAARGNLTLDAADVVGAVGSTGTGTLNLITLNGTGTSSFSSTINVADIDFGGNTTVTFGGNTTVTNDINFGNNTGAVATFADGANFTGQIDDASNNNRGTVNFNGASTVTGSIGTTTANDVNTVNFNGATNKSVNVTGSVFASNDIGVGGAGTTSITGQATVGDDVLFTADGTINFGDGLVSVADDFDTATDSQGTVIFAGAGAIGGDFGDEGREFKVLTVNGVGKTLTVGGNFDTADTTNLNGNLINVVGTVDVDNGQRINTTLTDSTTMGRIAATGVANVASGALVNITADPSIYVADGQNFTLIGGGIGGAVSQLTAGNITDDSYLLSFSQGASTNSLVLTAHRATASGASDTDNNASVLAALDEIGANGDATIDTVQANLATASTRQQVNDILAALLPTIDGGDVRAGFNASVQSLKVNDTRLASLRDGTASDTGMVAGQMGNGTYAWLQGFGQKAKQDERDQVAGYDADTYGAAFGVDTKNIAADTTVGISVSYANSQIDSNNITHTDTDVDSYQASLYGNLDLSKQTYLEGMLAYAYNDIDRTRHNVAGLGSNAEANYSSDQYIAYAEAGHDIALGAKTTLTPSVLAHYQHIAIDDYNETGAAGANLNVDSDDLDILEFGVGTELSWLLDGGDGSIIKPAINVGYRYDVIGDNVETTSSFAGAPGVAFKTEGFEPDQSTFNVGASLTLATEGNWEMSADYDYELKSDYDSHSAFLRAGYKW